MLKKLDRVYYNFNEQLTRYQINLENLENRYTRQLVTKDYYTSKKKELEHVIMILKNHINQLQYAMK